MNPYNEFTDNDIVNMCSMIDQQCSYHNESEDFYSLSKRGYGYNDYPTLN